MNVPNALRLTLLLCACGGALALESAPPDVDPGASAALRPFETRYAFMWHDMNAGSASFALKRLGDGQWSYSSRTEPRGLFRLFSAANATLESRMSIGPEGVRPLHFTATQGSATTPTATLDFDWEKLRVTGQVDATSIDVPLRAGVQDDLSVQVALMHALAAGNVPQGISLFDKSGIRDYEYTRTGTETLHTPLGDVATVIYRSHRANSSRSTRFWCAPSLGYIPLRAEQQHDGAVEWVMALRSLRRD